MEANTWGPFNGRKLTVIIVAVLQQKPYAGR